MSKVRKIAEITPNLPFSEFNFYELYRETFEHSELGRMKKILESSNGSPIESSKENSWMAVETQREIWVMKPGPSAKMI